MFIENDLELREAVAEANERIQAIQDYLGRAHHPDGQLRFPRGFLPTANELRKTLPFIRKQRLRQNIAYSFMLASVYDWLLQRTDLAATAADMVVKSYLALAGAIAEALLVDHFDGVLGKRQKFTSRTERLVTDGLIDQAHKTELDWLWDMRCRQHLFEIDDSEFVAYSSDDFRRASAAVNALLAAFRRAYEQGVASSAT